MRATTARLWLLGALSIACACGGDDDADDGVGGAGNGSPASTGAGGAGPGAGRGSGAGTGGDSMAGAGDAGSSDAGAGGADAEPPVDPDAICTAGGACEEVVELAPAQHVEGDIDYGALPPAGGPHNGCWGDFGVHDEPFAPENWVHNLEHGAVVLLHDCPDGCDAELTALEGFVAERSWAILTAYADMETRFAVVAWGYRLMSDELDLDAFADFYDAHADQAPESVPSGKPGGCP